MSKSTDNYDVPVIETSRLVLRELRETDFGDYERMCADAESMKFLGTGQPLSRPDAWRSLAFFLGHWQLRGFGMWAVTDKATGKLVGRVGFHQPVDWPGFEIGWLVDRQYWGQGFATEAARAALELAVPEYDQAHVISLIHPENTASIRVAEKIGESLDGETKLNGTRVLIYGIDLAE